MNDSLIQVMQQVQQVAMLGFIKSLFLYFVCPVAALTLANNFIGRKGMVTAKYVNDSVKRAHDEREKGDLAISNELKAHIQASAETWSEVKENIGYIKGAMNTLLKNGTK